ncbi:MAG: hypothetical protein ACRCXT_17685 [Paraclostridium sp.]
MRINYVFDKTNMHHGCDYVYEDVSSKIVVTPYSNPKLCANPILVRTKYKNYCKVHFSEVASANKDNLQTQIDELQAELND